MWSGKNSSAVTQWDWGRDLRSLVVFKWVNFCDSGEKQVKGLDAFKCVNSFPALGGTDIYVTYNVVF